MKSRVPLSGAESGTVEWEFLRGLFETAVYGGRVDNPFDMRVLRSYLGQFFDSAVVSGTPRSKRNLAPSVAVPTAPDYEVSVRCLVASLPLLFLWNGCLDIL